MKRSPLQRHTPLKASTRPRRSSRPRTTAARSAARGEPCLVRIPGVCNGNPETTVLAHYRLAGYCGTGMKPIDALGAHCCSACHDVADMRVKSHYTTTEIRLFHAEGVLRTIAEREKEGA